MTIKIAPLVAAIFISTLWARDNELIRRKAAEAQAKCTAATAALQSHLDKLDRSCKTKEDCEPRYFKVRSCDSPIIINKKAKIDEPQLIQLQNGVRAACPDLAKGPVCSPTPGFPICHKGKCLERSELPAEIPPAPDRKSLNRPFKFGLARFSCAPHDSTSIELTLTQDPITCQTKFSRREFNSLNINIWQNDFVEGPTKGGDWGIDPQSGTGSVCAGGGCSNMNSIRVQVDDSQKENFIRGKIEATSDDGIKIPHQEFKVIWCPGYQRCG